MDNDHTFGERNAKRDRVSCNIPCMGYTFCNFTLVIMTISNQVTAVRYYLFVYKTIFTYFKIFCNINFKHRFISYTSKYNTTCEFSYRGSQFISKTSLQTPSYYTAGVITPTKIPLTTIVTYLQKRYRSRISNHWATIPACSVVPSIYKQSKKTYSHISF